jgi:PAS domain S-box-containing protein
METANNQEISLQQIDHSWQDQLQRMEQRFQATFEQAAVGMAHVALNGTWLQANQKLCEIVGYTREELLATKFQSITYNDDLEKSLSLVKRLLAGEIATYTMEKRYIRKDGSLVWINLTVSLARDEANVPQYFISVIENIDERKRVEVERNDLLLRAQHARKEAEVARRQLAENQQRLALAQKVGRIGTFEWDIVSNEVVWTPELEALYGLEVGGFGGKYENWSQRVYPDDLQRAEESLHGAAIGGPPYNVEFRIVLPDGSQRWMLAKGEVTAYDVQNRPIKMIGVNIDVTERIEAELEKDRINQSLQDLNANLEAIVTQRTEILRQVNTELQRSNQELQDFAYVASHDLQEPLRKIQAFGNLLEEEYGPALGDGKAYLDRMRNAAGRMRVLIEDLLTFSRVTTKAQPFVPVDLATVVYEIVDDLEPRLKATQGRVEIGTLPTIEADHQQMHQLFQNLLVNAVKFCRPGVPPLVKVYAELHDDPELVVDDVETEAKLAEISTTLTVVRQHYQIFVEDNGIGFDEKYLDRIFTVFQRLHGKSEYEGTGIGLAVVRKIVERHGGTITATSSVGQGATFIVTLPVSQNEMKETELL